MGLWGESVQGKGSEWRSASTRRPLQMRTTHHGNIPKTPPLSPEPQTCANWGQFFFQWVAVVPSLQSPPPRGGRPSFHCFATQYLLQASVPHCHTYVLALLSHYFQSVTCVYSAIFSLQRRCTGCTRAKPAPKQAGQVAQPAAKAAARQKKTAPCSSASSSLAGATHPVCNSSKWAILVPRNSLPFLWTPNNICVA